MVLRNFVYINHHTQTIFANFAVMNVSQKKIKKKVLIPEIDKKASIMNHISCYGQYKVGRLKAWFCFNRLTMIESLQQ